jgi:hypothetical protein
LYGIQLLIDVELISTKPSPCSGYGHSPLPSERELWEPITSAEWAARYKKFQDRHQRDTLLNIQDLGRARGGLGIGPNAAPEDARIFTLVCEWCENLDEFGMVVWMAVMNTDRTST